MLRLTVFLAVLILSAGVARADQILASESDFLAAMGLAATTIDFDDLPGGSVVTTQYSGITFSNAGIWDWSADNQAGGNVTPPNNLYNLDVVGGGAVGFVFDQPVVAVGLYNSSPGVATDRVQMTLFDSQDGIVFQGDLPETQINFLGYIADNPSIVRGQAVGISPTNGFIFLDNLSYAVPEPSTFALLAMGAVGLLFYTLRRRKPA